MRGYAARRTYTRKGHGTTVAASELFTCEYVYLRDALKEFESDALEVPWEPGH